ncbi:hypothetical protein ACH5RR_017131 [Cinchona calisaya]|uniref:Uncharacterized protein n=1 Tax=Cinchona calisaya TaxID=153742 RepID=A0ABD3A1J2_9GENT
MTTMYNVQIATEVSASRSQDSYPTNRWRKLEMGGNKGPGCNWCMSEWSKMAQKIQGRGMDQPKNLFHTLKVKCSPPSRFLLQLPPSSLYLASDLCLKLGNHVQLQFGLYNYLQAPFTFPHNKVSQYIIFSGGFLSLVVMRRS